MIKKAVIKNFQIHKKLEIEFTEGLNVLVGETGRGKSAVIRAMRLLLENQPRGGDKKYLRLASKLPLEIQLEDDQGNVITRKKKKYMLNKSTFKAFGSEVPEPIRNLYPLKEVNWHRQLDPHFLILTSAGNAAKILGASTGLEEQEHIVKEIKDRLSVCKNEIKHLRTNNAEAKRKMKQLRPVVKHLMVARSIKTKEDNLELMQQEVETLVALIKHIQKCEKKIEKYNISQHLARVTGILALVDELEKKEEDTKLLVDIINKLKDDSTVNEEKLNTFIKSINGILNQLDKVDHNESLHKSIRTTLVQLKKADKIMVERKAEIKTKQKEYDKLLAKFKTCPFCNSTV
jgi:DNA repair ATPase RecN